MSIKKPWFKKEDGLADCAEPEMARLDYPCMHRPDRDFINRYRVRVIPQVHKFIGVK